MLERPRFKPSLSVHLLPPVRVVLLDERRSYVLHGRAYVALAPLLTGTLDTEELIRKLEPDVAAHEVLYALDTLERRGHVAEACDVPEPRAAFWHQLGATAAAAEQAVAAARARVVSVHADTAREAVAAALAGSGFREDTAADVVVVITDDYLRPELQDLNAALHRSRTPWILAKPVGSVLWIGPLFAQTGGPCWACMAERIQGNRHIETFLARASGGTRPPVSPAPGALPATLTTAGHLIALELARWRAVASLAPVDRLHTLNLDTMESRAHAVVRRPQCPVCGDPEWRRREPQPIVLQPRPKVHSDDGGFRSVRPEETFARLAHHISPVTGVVSALEPLLGRAGEPAWSVAAGHNFAMMVDSLFFLRQNLRGRSGGKGATEIQAKVGGLCEAIERYSGVWRAEEPVRRSSFRAMNGEALSPVGLMNYSDAQYRGRREWNAAQPHTRFHIVPEPFDEDRPVDWIPVWSLTTERWAWAPAAYCYFGHPDLRDWFFCVADANGAAAGNSIEEAILQGLLETIERDAVALWWYNRLQKPVVDLDSFDAPEFRTQMEYHARMSRALHVLDITSDLGVPTFVGVSYRLDRPVEDIIIGFGAHLEPRLAIMRAISEVNQFLPAVLKSNADGSTKYWFDDPEAIKWWKTATVAAHPYVMPDPRAAARTASDYPRSVGDDLRADVERLVAIAANAGLEVFVRDLTRPDIGFPVAKLLVPGLRHFWRRLGSGRLYDVPVRMGWLSAPTPEDGLNPVSIFF